ncbi:hypothetical protein SKAU_G00060540 [Synaphobranchus kaupii]|uniref:Gypsy retrotransposon integrase-like protein 1 n=1 Tax=Synaphobranchus kaupii TaxID=118154 RepID=A0A9Q1G5Y5_SYNKA|nr:hypothetical protein SKAU_G00060540 [Synaphobranchus kaupii]
MLDLYIVEKGGPALWGRDWLRKLQLDWRSIKSLHVSLTPTPKSTEAKLEKVLEAAAPVFKNGVGTLKHIKGKIVLNDGATPRFHKARPVPYAIRQKVEAELDRLEADGILSKVDWSPWATPIVPVAKKSGALRVCGDFKVTVNPVLQAEQYPLPRIEDIFANLSGGRRFTKVDLAEAYLQMEMEEDSKVFLTINTLKGLYRYNRLVFGVASAPAIWQRAMDQVLQGVPGTQCYLDDIIVTGANDDEHLENLQKVLKRLEDYGLRLACDASPYGIGAVMSHVMRDGTERPVAFASRSLSPAEKNYEQIDKEALGLVWGVKRFNQYLYGREFILVTDHQPLVSIFNPQKAIPATAAARMQRWALFLGGHRYQIEFKRTLSHANADGLSRLPLETVTTTNGDKEPLEMFTLMQIESLPVTAEMIQGQTRRDVTLSQVCTATQNGWTNQQKSPLAPYFQRRDELTIDSGCLMWGMRIIIPTKLRARVLEELHFGHLGVVKMKALARSYVWWPGIDQQIEQLAMHCSGCQRVQNEPTIAPLHSWEWPASPWQRIHIDFAGPFMGTTFLVVVDACSKWPEVFTMNSTTTSHTIDVLRSLFARTGVPEQLVTDNGPQFTAN